MSLGWLVGVIHEYVYMWIYDSSLFQTARVGGSHGWEWEWGKWAKFQHIKVITSQVELFSRQLDVCTAVSKIPHLCSRCYKLLSCLLLSTMQSWIVTNTEPKSSWDIYLYTPLIAIQWAPLCLTKHLLGHQVKCLNYINLVDI